MYKRSAANSDWQACGGTLRIPVGWFVYGANFDAVEPYIIIVSEDKEEENKLFVPKPLAYYLSVHSCGSRDMRNEIMEHGRNEVRTKIKSALGI